jgi:sarcosine oxidase
LSLGSIRQQFSTEENIRLSSFGMPFLQHIADYLAVDGEVPNVSYVERGYLFVATQAGGYVSGVSPPEDQAPDCADFELDYAPWQEVVWPSLAERIPAFAAVKLTRAWACHYETNTVDQNGILGPHLDLRNLLFENGFSGHNIQQSPAVGRAIAEWIEHGAWQTIDLARFGYRRLVHKEKLLELNVV